MRIIELAETILDKLEDSPRYSAEYQSGHDHVCVRHNTHLFFSGRLRTAAGFMNKPLDVALTQTQFPGSAAAVLIDFLPPGTPFVLPKRLADQFAHRTALAFGN
jgi:hypothetical protein